MSRRSGATLIEVLVAIFVMAIGMLALLTLFPIGVLTMRQAIQDDRTAHAAASATSIARMLFSSVAYDSWFKRANPTDPALADALVEGPSYALYLDGVGINSYLPPYQDWIGGQSNGIRRLDFKDAAGTVLKPLLWQVSPDDIVFDKNGIPAQITPGVFERNSTYSWGYLVRRPMNGKPNVVDLTIVVYNDRPLVMNSSLQAGETVYDAIFPDPNSATNTIISVTWNPAVGDVPPAIRVGGWILDTTPVIVQPAAGGNPPVYGPSHARFYRVVSFNQTSNTTADLEVQTPIKDFPPGGGPGKIAVLDGIAEVFEKGPVQFQLP